MMDKKIIQDFELSLFKGKGKLCSVFGKPNDDSIICNVCHCNDTALWNKCHYAKGYKEYNNIPPKEWVNIIFDNMETKEIKIEIPKGYEIDKEKSTFEKIVFKPIVKRWRDNKNIIKGYYITSLSIINPTGNTTCNYNLPENRNVFATEKQAKSALAMAQISQIMANDERFGGVVAELEKGDQLGKRFYTIKRGRASNANSSNLIIYFEEVNAYEDHHFLTFHTKEQAILFLKENEDLVKDYLMID